MKQLHRNVIFKICRKQKLLSAQQQPFLKRTPQERCSTHPLSRHPRPLQHSQRVHEPAPGAGVLWAGLVDVEPGRAVGPGRQTEHLHQAADGQVGYPAAILCGQRSDRPVGVTLE